ncbi:MAG: hypothetical protein IKX19_02535 [Clostridia bacterium]|nr:hypothetical protein [Clostridia bacterium]
MKKTIDISGFSDEELIRKFSVEINGKRFIRANVLDAIGRRNAERANRKPGDPGTVENPIFKNGRAYIYSSTNRLIIWEDYSGEIPEGDGVIYRVNPETTEMFVLTHEMEPTVEQKKMVQAVKSRPITFASDCPKSSPEQLARFRRFGEMRNHHRAETQNG